MADKSLGCRIPVNIDGYPFTQDVSTGSFVYVDLTQHQIHVGESFSYRDTQTLASAAVQDYLITTPNTTQWAHFGYEVESMYKVTIELFEASDKTGTTLQTTVFNRNRNSVTANTTTIHSSVSGGSTDGTLLMSRAAGSASAAVKILVQIGEAQERILKQNTKYIFRITSGANSNVISARLSWHEHVDTH